MDHRLVVVGASTGGVAALARLVSRLAPPFPAALLAVLHIGAGRSQLPSILGARTALPVAFAADGETIEPGRLYIAPPDHHLLVEGDTLVLTRGPKEHHTRPAIDPLFRSAALAHGPRVIGVVLSGTLDDGVAGLQVIKACGGLAIVQDPHEAERPQMPANALRHVEDVDHCAALDEIAELLQSLAARPLPQATPMPRRPALAVQELAMSTARSDGPERVSAMGRPSSFACPECHGALWQIDDSDPPRLRCHTGHAFSLLSLQDTLARTTEEALWSAIRALQEHALAVERLAEAEGLPARPEQTRRLRERAEVLRRLVEEED